MAAGACCCGGLPAAGAWVKVFTFPLPFLYTSTQSFAWIWGALDEGGVFRRGGCYGFAGCCTCCANSIVVWWVCSPKWWLASKLIPPGSAGCSAEGAYPCGYGWTAGLERAGTGAGAFCMHPASWCSLVIPTLILLYLSVRKLTVLVVEASFSTRLMIWLSREWMAARIAVMMSRLIGS